MTTVRVYRVLVYEGTAEAVQAALDRRGVKDVQLSTGYCIREANLGNIILNDAPVQDRLEKELLKFVQLERKQAADFYPDDDSRRQGYLDGLDFVLNRWKPNDL